MKKNNIRLVVGIVCVGLLGFFATNLVRNRGKSDTELLEFSIKDTTSIDKLIITDQHNREITLIKNNQVWVDSKGNCVIQEPIHTILETIKNIQFKGYVPEGSRKNIVRLMVGNHLKVEIFQNNEWAKTWYIGHPTQDHYGTYMLLETPDEKSDLPVIMKVKGLDGIIEPRFFADYRRWKCTEVFAIPLDSIAEVKVTYFDKVSENFHILKNNSHYKLWLNGKQPKATDTLSIVQYLQNFKKIHYELANFELSDKQVDSVKRTKPFCKLSVKETNGIKHAVKMYRMPFDRKTMNDVGDSIAYNPDRFWCELPSGELVKCQYFVFNPLIMGKLYFNNKHL